jgi:transcriptional regulator with AAA-type ATPase domain/tetratricopeptide (TPR) repeat protein
MTPLDELLGDSPGIQAVRATLKRLLTHAHEGRPLPPLLILGDTGTGKGLVTRALHQAGPRARGPLVEINCAAIPESLLEAELFGFERGAFTDARQPKPGLFQSAHRGTLFLDEIGLMPAGVQGKFLKVLEDRTVRRLGSTRSEPADVALVAATSEDLLAAVQAHQFREDLYHRLSVVTVNLPPLAERGTDVLLLAEHFLRRACADYGVGSKTLTPAAREALLAARWPGNIRELANVMERVALLNDAPLVTVDALALPARPDVVTAARSRLSPRRHTKRLKDRDALVAALRETQGNIAQAAARLGMPRGTLRYQMEKLGLAASEPFSPPSRAEPPPGEPEPTVPTRPTLADVPLQWSPRRLAFLGVLLAPAPARDIGPETAAALVILGEKVASFGGHVEERGPRDLIAVFGLAPVEDAAQRAGHAALAMQKVAERAQPAGSEHLHLTIALHMAPALVGQAGHTPVIDIEAKRAAYRELEALLLAASPDTILVSVAAAPALERRFELRPDSPAGPSGACRLEGLTRTGLAPGGVLTNFVGRQSELALLQSRFELAGRGQGQVVGIVGEPGIGKSRLLVEFRQRCTGLTVLRGACASYGSGIPYLPVLGLLRDGCGLSGAESPATVEATVRARCEELGLSADAGLHILPLLGVPSEPEPSPAAPPEVVRAETFDAIRRLVLTERHRRPVVVMVEDVHWIDATSEALLQSLAEAIAGTAVLLVTTYRPGSRPPWMDTSYATQVALPPLSPDDSLEVVRGVLGSASLSRSLAERILARAEGNPFFLEELSRVTLARDAVDVPDTVQDVLQARIDRLPDEARGLLQVASVIGREVPRPLLLAIAHTPTADTALADLRHLEFLLEHPSAEGPVYVFKHALTQEVAYASVPPERQRALHGVIGRTLAAGGGADEILAHHFVRAHEWEAALPHFLRAGERAARALSNREALAFYDQAEAVAARLGAAVPPATRLTIHEARAQLYSGLSDFRQARAEGERAAALARLSNDPVREGEALVTIAWAAMWLAAFPQALADARQALDVAASAGIPKVAAGAHSVVGVVQCVTGELEHSRLSFERALAVERTPDTAPHQAYALVVVGEFHNWAGDYAEALTWLDEGVRLAREHRVLLPLLEGAWFQGVALVGRGDYDEARARFDEAQVLCEKIGDEVMQHRILNSRGWLSAEQGDLAQALEWNRQGAAAARARGDAETISNAELNLADLFVATGEHALARELLEGIRARVEDPTTSVWMQWRYTTHLAASLGELALARGEWAEASRHAQRCLELATRYNARKYLVRGGRLVGEIALAGPRPQDAEAPLRHALALAEAIGNPTQLWKTHVACARLYRALGQPDAAHAAREAGRAVAERMRASLASPVARATFEHSPLLRPAYAPED